MIKIKPFLIATLLLTGFALPAVAQIGEARNNLSVGIIGGVNLNCVSFSSSIFILNKLLISSINSVAI